MNLNPFIPRLKVFLALPLLWWALCLFELADN
jgi:hypothetical protein